MRQHRFGGIGRARGQFRRLARGQQLLPRCIDHGIDGTEIGQLQPAVIDIRTHVADHQAGGVVNHQRIGKRLGRQIRHAGRHLLAFPALVTADQRIARFRQQIHLGLQLRTQCAEAGNQRMLGLQRLQGLRDGLRGTGKRGNGRQRRRLGRGQQALDQGFTRPGYRGDFRHLGHGKGATHGVHGAQQGLIHRLRLPLAGCQPGVQGGQMGGDLGLQDIQQHAVDLRRRAFHHRQQRLGLRLRHGGRFGGIGGIGAGRLRARSRDVMDFLASGDAIGNPLDRHQVCSDDTASLQRGIQLRQHFLHGQGDHRHHGRAGRTQAVAHAVEHAFDGPAELTQGACTDQAATALEGMEDPSHRQQQFRLPRVCRPCRQHRAQVGQFLVELLQEHLADFQGIGVHQLAVVLETILVGHSWHSGRGRLCRRGCGHPGSRKSQRTVIERGEKRRFFGIPVQSLRDDHAGTSIQGRLDLLTVAVGNGRQLGRTQLVLYRLATATVSRQFIARLKCLQVIDQQRAIQRRDRHRFGKRLCSMLGQQRIKVLELGLIGQWRGQRIGGGLQFQRQDGERRLGYNVKFFAFGIDRIKRAVAVGRQLVGCGKYIRIVVRRRQR